MGSRHVFNASLVVNRKVAITAVGLDIDGNRLFLGLEDGMLEEFSLECFEEGATASLTARKPIVLNHPILTLLPATPSNCLVLITGDGSLRFVHSDTLESKIMHKGPILAAAISLPSSSSSSHSLPRLAIITKAGISRTTRLAVHEILPAGGQVAGWRSLWEVDLPPTHGVPPALAWSGDALMSSAGDAYALAWQRQSDGTGAWRELFSIEPGTHAAAIALPRISCAFLIAGAVGLVVNPAGEPVGNPIPLEDFPPVRAMAASEGHVAAICEDGIHVIDSRTGQHVQYLDYGEGNTPAPGQPLRAASGGGVASLTVAVAGRHKVWVLTPVSPSRQALELLEQREYGAALDLAAAGESRGEEWAYEAYAQAGLLLMQDGHFSKAVDALERCPPKFFQPSELFPLFPEHTSPWKPYILRPHWELHAPLEPLQTVLERVSLEERGGGGGGTASVETDAQSAIQCVVQYLFRARELPGTEHLDGVDTLLLHLLLDLGAQAQATAFTGVPNAVSPDAVSERFQNAGLKHALATLWASKGAAESALDIWRDLATTSASASQIQHADTERQEALEGASALLQSSEVCSPQLVLSHIPWLLDTCPAAAQAVLASRDDLKPEDVLSFLPRGQDARWRYLEVLISSGRSLDPSLHTELALSLTDAVLRAAPDLRDIQNHSSSTRGNTNDYSNSEQPLSAEALPSTLPSALPSTLPSGSPSSSPSPCRGGGGGPLPSNALTHGGISVAALVSKREEPNPEKEPDPIQALRLRLRRHLQASALWDQTAVRSALESSMLYQELIVAAAKSGDHTTALRLLAVTLNDVDGAVAYAVAFLPPTKHRVLLQMLLDPGISGSPQWEAAAHVVATLGDSLDPLEIIAAAPGSMPVAAALPLVAPLVRERLHRRRQGQVTSALQRSRLACRSAGRVEVEARRVVVDEGRACLDCHLRIGGKVFVVEPRQQGLDGDGDANETRVVCLNCWNKQDRGRPNES